MQAVKPINIGVCGLGTVGSGTVRLLLENAQEIARRAGRVMLISKVAGRTCPADLPLGSAQFSDDILTLANDPDIDILVELIGGIDAAKELVLTALNNKKHVVTANKALIAEHGTEIFSCAEANGVSVMFEAAVAGGIPIIKALREGLAANKINWLAGIINGTGNFILTEMRDKGRNFADVLAEAQALGYAEADPTFDVEGIDAAHKLTIMAAIAYGIPLQFERCYTEGIGQITRADVQYADELGYRIKHLGISTRTADGIDLRVHPTMVPIDKPIATIDGVLNAVMVNGNAVGDTLYVGAGAGAGATASAVVADIMDLARSIDSIPKAQVNHLAFGNVEPLKVLDIEQINSCYYLRIEAEDKAGVLASVASILSDKGISIEAIIQKEPAQSGLAQIILLTHLCNEGVMNKAIGEIEQLQAVQGKLTRIRVSHLQ